MTFSEEKISNKMFTFCNPKSPGKIYSGDVEGISDTLSPFERNFTDQAW